jgi:hypothetical protein
MVPRFLRQKVGALTIGAVMLVALVLGGCEVGEEGPPAGTNSGGFEVQYCESDGRDGLQSDRCTTDPDRYGDGRYTGSPYGG